eukprot:142691-Pelagomonas_calceolata.AAC.6
MEHCRDLIRAPKHPHPSTSQPPHALFLSMDPTRAAAHLTTVTSFQDQSASALPQPQLTIASSAFRIIEPQPSVIKTSMSQLCLSLS